MLALSERHQTRRPADPGTPSVGTTKSFATASTGVHLQTFIVKRIRCDLGSIVRFFNKAGDGAAVLQHLGKRLAKPRSLKSTRNLYTRPDKSYLLAEGYLKQLTN